MAEPSDELSDGKEDTAAARLEEDILRVVNGDERILFTNARQAKGIRGAITIVEGEEIRDV